MRPPQSMKPLFWNVDLNTVEVDRDVDFVLTCVLERGKMADVHWVIRPYGLTAFTGSSAKRAVPS